MPGWILSIVMSKKMWNFEVLNMVGKVFVSYIVHKIYCADLEPFAVKCFFFSLSPSLTNLTGNTDNCIIKPLRFSFSLPILHDGLFTSPKLPNRAHHV